MRGADATTGVSLLRRVLAILVKGAPERDHPSEVVIEQEDREIERPRDELARSKGVHRE